MALKLLKTLSKSIFRISETLISLQKIFSFLSFLEICHISHSLFLCPALHGVLCKLYSSHPGFLDLLLLQIS